MKCHFKFQHTVSYELMVQRTIGFSIAYES